MSSSRDFFRSVIADALLPLVRQLFEDAVLEIVNDRRLPTRTDYEELRDAVNGMRGQVSSATSTLRRVEKRLADLEERLVALGEGQPIP